ncbi:carboxypeptidase-like regulatory domain-containing protein [Hymenobacter nivis]|uniref:Carboxypeptidase-like regulatory domain-containing protein n=1 Tax=Hymenobacter nivis TaxID=1850093 RepID=A0A502H113_9BACT|nr:carboxypeptidase-like regulatory domain-containing protein [Hymenobacter nivis]TPG67003.1 carboxypeptidase-like regulatory domain-containing protein [Hymenobacter nivis]
MRLFTVALLLLAAALGALPARAQLVLDGQVRDARTQRPLAYASVFLANTTFGTTTDSTGRFALAGVPGGHYEVMVSYVGYQLYQKTVDLQQSLTLAANVLPATTQLDEVVVHATKNRPADYQRFLQQFLGRSAFSRQCRIENPQDLVVYYDEQRRELTAAAPRGVRVVNQALGYRITYHNFDFKILYNASRCVFVAAPAFEALPTADAKKRRRWDENRRKAYAGSLPHFLRSVREGHLAEEGFLVQAMVVEPKSAQAQEHVAAAGDSLAAVFVPEPGLLARVYKAPLAAAQLCASAAPGAPSGRLQFADAVQVTYQGEQPDALYATDVAVARRNSQLDAAGARWQGAKNETALGRAPYDPILEVSELRLLGPPALILPNGYLANPLSVKVDGYWSFEKVGENLPLDYAPNLVK